MTSFDENYPFALDDTPERRSARIELFKTTLLPIGNALIAAYPKTMRWAYYLDDVIKQYQNIRDDAKRVMNGFGDHGHLVIIDRHKIAAAMLMATLDVAPLRIINNQNAETEGELLANEILAFKSAVRVLGEFSRHDAATSVDKPSITKAVFPPVQEGISYQYHAYRALHHARCQGKERLNLPLLAHWMFYIEQYWVNVSAIKPVA